MNIDNGGPVFPCQELDGQGSPRMGMEFGMTLRDHFAGLAMARLIECSSTPAYANTIAIEAYKYADAMIKARK